MAEVFREDDLDVHVFCQSSIPASNLGLAHDRFPGRVHLVPAWSLPHERLGWQWLPWRRILTDFDVLFVQGNPRTLSSVLLTCLAKWRRRPVVVWGQAHTANARSLTENLRLWWWRRFDYAFVYTDAEVEWLRMRGFRRQHLVGMNNGLDQRAIDAAAAKWSPPDLVAWRLAQGVAGRELVLSCARLEPKNEFHLWIEAMPALLQRHPQLLWCVIGDGRERSALERLVQDLRLKDHVRWLGTILEEEQLAPWFLSSGALVHPASIGLTLLHAFGYGLPVVTHGDPAGQMPEFGAFVPGETGIVYRRGDVAGLAAAARECLEDAPRREQMGNAARRIAREQFNVQIMAKRFAALAWKAGEHSKPG